MIRSVGFFLFVLIGLARAQSPPSSQTILRIFLCPACDHKFSASVVVKTLVSLGQDPDFLPRYQGAQILLFAPITCTKCYYSGTQENFDAVLSLEQKEKLAQGIQPRIPLKAETTSDEIPASLRYELQAQTYQRLWESRYFLIAQQYLLASWAVRLTANPLNFLEKKEKKEVAVWLQKNRYVDSKNVCRDDLALAQEWLAKMDTLSSPEEQWACLGALITLFRAYGENTQVAVLVPRGASLLEKEKFQSWEQSIQESIQQERFYQQLALLWFEKGFAQETTPDINLLYLGGELARRLEQWEKARVYYEKVLVHPMVSKSFQMRIQKQIQWLPE